MADSAADISETRTADILKQRTADVPLTRTADVQKKTFWKTWFILRKWFEFDVEIFWSLYKSIRR